MPRALKRHRPLAAEQWRTQVWRAGRSQQDVQSPTEHTRLIYSLDALLTLMRLTDSGQTETNCREGACCWGRGILSSSPTALLLLCLHRLGQVTQGFPQPPHPFLVFSPPTSLSFNCLDSPPSFSTNQITDSSFLLQLQEFSPPAPQLEDS